MVKFKPYVVMREMGDGTGVVYDPDTNRAVTLNKTAIFTWKKISEGSDIEEVAKAIFDSFEVSSLEQAKNDVMAFIKQLQEKELILEDA